VNDTYQQFSAFLQLPQKKILSFGGWGLSTDPSTYNELRYAMSPDNVDTFVGNIVDYIGAQQLDGVDIDWEYPGVRFPCPLYHLSYIHNSQRLFIGT
jgi:GH18 family chitinase